MRSFDWMRGQWAYVARAALAAVVAQASACERANSDRSHSTCQPASPVGIFSTWAISHRFTKFYTSRVEIFRMFFIRSSLPMTSVNHAKFRGNWFARFSEIRNTDTHGQTQQLYTYIDTGIVLYTHRCNGLNYIAQRACDAPSRICVTLNYHQQTSIQPTLLMRTAKRASILRVNVNVYSYRVYTFS